MESSDAIQSKSVPRRISMSSSCSDHDIGTKNLASAKATGEWDVYSAIKCQQVVARMAQGQTVEIEERIKVAFSIRMHARTNRTMAKVMASQLYGEEALRTYFTRLLHSDSKCVDGRITLTSLVRIWNKFYCHILPDLQSVLCSYEENGLQVNSTIRHLMLVAFRDVIVSNEQCSVLLASDTAQRSADLQNMLLLLEQTTRDNSHNYKSLSDICCLHFGDTGVWTGVEISDKETPRRKMAVSDDGVSSSEVSFGATAAGQRHLRQQIQLQSCPERG